MLKKIILGAFVLCLFSQIADARGRIFKRYRSVHRSYSTSKHYVFTQPYIKDTCTTATECAKTAKIADRKAKYMAIHGIQGHVLMHLGIGNGTVEGCGADNGKCVRTTVATCHSGRLGSCIADRAYYSHRTRMTYRVRIFR